MISVGSRLLQSHVKVTAEKYQKEQQTASMRLSRF